MVQNRGILITLRAAAIVIIATGLNDVLASALPRYEPLYLFLAAVALVSLLDGILVGLLTAVLSIGFYALLFVPREQLLTSRIALPALAAVATAILGATIRGAVRVARRRRRDEAGPEPVYVPSPPLLETSDAGRVADNAEVLAAIDELRAELRAAIAELTAARDRADELETLRRSQNAEREAVEARSRQIEHERDWALKVAEESRARADRERTQRLEAERQLAEAREESASMAGRVAELELSAHERDRASSEAAALRHSLELERTRAEGEKSLRESQSSEAATLRSRIAELEESLTKAAPPAESDELRRALTDARNTRDRARAEAIAEKQRADRLEKAVASMRDEDERRLAEQKTHADALEARVAEATTRASELEATVAETERQLAEERHRTEEAVARSAELAVSIAEAERTASEAQRTAAEAERKAADAEARVVALERAAAAARGEVERLLLAETERAQAAGRLAELEAAVVAERERAAEAERAAAAAREEAQAAQARIAALEGDATQFDAKLQTIVTHLASDHEADLGQALGEKEEARAEARALSAKLATVQRRLDDLEAEAERRAAETMQAEWQQRLTDLEGLLAEERANRERLEGEAVQFDTKLQTIVTHLASDHEADLGQALGEKEEARAEARALTKKLAAVQRRLDDIEALLTETRTAAQGEIDRLRAQLAARPAGPAAQPPAARPRVLVVHPDADVRAAAGASLERAGYEVVGAADGLEALRVAMAAQPEVVIAESSMPKMDGRELCALLKSQDKTSHIRFILLMRGNDEMPRGECMPDEVLRKPVPVETMKATLASLLASPR